MSGWPPHLAELPDVVRALVPELDRFAFPEERRANCSACPMITEGFDPQTRCCTYHPDLPNYTVGRALRRGGGGADLVRRRLRDAEGLTPRGVGWGSAQREAYLAHRQERFGKDNALRCPFWVEGPLSCGIWRDRGTVCRTWFCRLERGPRGLRAWWGLRDLLAEVEIALADACVARGGGPRWFVTPAQWEAWYLDCAEHVDQLAAAQIPVTSRLAGLRVALATHVARRDLPLPARVAQASRAVRTDGGRLRLASYSWYDDREFPVDVLAVLACVGDGRSVDDVRAEAAALLGRELPRDWLDELWAAGLLVDADAEADDPEPPPDELFHIAW